MFSGDGAMRKWTCLGAEHPARLAGLLAFLACGMVPLPLHAQVETHELKITTRPRVSAPIFLIGDTPVGTTEATVVITYRQNKAGQIVPHPKNFLIRVRPPGGRECSIPAQVVLRTRQSVYECVVAALPRR